MNILGHFIDDGLVSVVVLDSYCSTMKKRPKRFSIFSFRINSGNTINSNIADNQSQIVNGEDIERLKSENEQLKRENNFLKTVILNLLNGRKTE